MQHVHIVRVVGREFTVSSGDRTPSQVNPLDMFGDGENKIAKRPMLSTMRGDITTHSWQTLPMDLVGTLESSRLRAGQTVPVSLASLSIYGVGRDEVG